MICDDRLILAKLIDGNQDGQVQATEYVAQAIEILDHEALLHVANRRELDFKSLIKSVAANPSKIAMNFQEFKKLHVHYYSNGIEELATHDQERIALHAKQLEALVSQSFRRDSLMERALAGISVGTKNIEMSIEFKKAKAACETSIKR